MKRFLGILVMVSWCNVGFAEVEEMFTIETNRISFDTHHHSDIFIATTCVDGYKFVVTKGIQSVSIVQFFERAGGVSLPAKC